jgi:hypothetical protein
VVLVFGATKELLSADHPLQVAAEIDSPQGASLVLEEEPALCRDSSKRSERPRNVAVMWLSADADRLGA